MDRDVHPSRLRGILADDSTESRTVRAKLDEMRDDEREREDAELERLADTGEDE